LLACIAGFVSFSEGSIIYTLFPAYASYLNFLPVQIGILLTIYMVGRTVLFMPLGELVDRLGCKFMIMLGLLGISAPFAAITRATSFWQFALIAVLLSVLGGALYLGALTAASSIGGAEKRGRILGVYGIVTGLGWSVAPVVGGMAADLIAPTAPYTLCALLALLAATVVWTLK